MMRALANLGWALVTALPAAAQTPGASPEGAARATAAVGELERAFDAAYFERYPWLALERGRPGGHALVGGDFGAEGLKRWSTTVGRLLRSLDGIDRTALPPAVLADAQALRDALNVERLLLEALTPERWNADTYVRRVQRLMLGVLHAPGDEVERSRALGTLLDGLGEGWREARRSLMAPRDEWSREANLRLDLLDALLRTTVQERWVAAGPAVERDERRARRDAALAANAEFRRWLESSPPRAGGANTRFGSERWERLAQAATGHGWTLGAIRREVLAELARAERHQGARWRTARATAAEPARSAEALRRLVAATAGPSSALALEPEPFLTDDGQALRLLSHPERGELLLVRPDALAGADDADLLALARAWGPRGAAAFRRGVATSERGPRFRWNRALAEGWRLLALERPLPERTGATPEALEAACAWLRVLEGARLLAALELHALDYDEDEVVEGLQRRTGLSLERCRREALEALTDPLRGVGFLGWYALRTQVERQVAAGRDPEDALAEVLAAVARHPQRGPGAPLRKDFPGSSG